MLLESPAVAQYVNDFQFESKDDAYKHFKEQFSNSPIVDSVTPDQLPASFRINMKDPGEVPDHQRDLLLPGRRRNRD